MSRKAFKPTQAMRRSVAACAGAGFPHSDICMGLGICRNTLLRHFGRELEQGAFLCRMKVVEALYRAALRGRGSAAKLYLANIPSAVRPPAPIKEPKLGKKEQAQQDAGTAADGTSWSALLDPKRVN